jgi:hypothetical protein
MDMDVESSAAAEQDPNPNVSPPIIHSHVFSMHPAPEGRSSWREKGDHSPIHQTTGIVLSMSGPDIFMSAICQQNANRLLPTYYQPFGE